MEIRRRATGCLLVAMTGILFASGPAVAGELNPMLNAKYGVWLGGFFPQLDSKIRINGQVIGDGDNINLEDTLGLEDSKSVLWGGASWRISQRNNIEFEVASLNRDGSTQVQSVPLQIGDSIAQAGANIDTKFDMTLVRLTYGYSIVRSEKTDVQLKLGVHLLDFSSSLQLSGAVEVCNPGEAPPNCTVITGSTTQTESEDVTAPLPHFGASFSHAFSPKLAVSTQAIGFAIKIDNIKGSLLEIDADVVYNPWQHVGLGTGLRFFNANVESKGSRLNGKFEYEYFGPVAYVKFTF